MVSKEAMHFTLCKKHGDMQKNHNTGDCKKYDLDGSPKKGFAGNNAQASYVQMSAKIAKLLKNLTRNSSTQKRSASASMSVIMMTRTCLDVMDLVAL